MKLAKHILFSFMAFCVFNGYTQDTNANNAAFSGNTLPFEAFLAYVKVHHPIAKQAQLKLTKGEATILKARGGFDPKLEANYSTKQFKTQNYWETLKSTFTIPTWFGVEFKAEFEQNTGDFLNPQLSVPQNGLYNIGVAVPVGQGLLINERMAALKQAKYFKTQTQAERDLLLNQLLFEASKAYIKWVEAYNEQTLYNTFITQAKIRYQSVARSVEEGDKAAIDSTEAKINLDNRLLDLESARLKTRQAALELSNFLWFQEVPIEVKPEVIPLPPTVQQLSDALYLDQLAGQSNALTEHPKLQWLNAQVNSLEVARKLSINKLLPKLDLQYFFVTPDVQFPSTVLQNNYKAGLQFKLPLFLRKERANVKLANVQLQETRFEQVATEVKLQNKINAVEAELETLSVQNQQIEAIVASYKQLLTAELRKFAIGESSVFLVNTREQQLLNAQLKANSLTAKLLIAKAKLFNSWGMVF